jgi:transposase
LLRGNTVNEIHELKRQGLSITQISALTGCDPKTIRKYLDNPNTPEYGPREPRPSLLDPFKPYLKERMAAGIWNGVVLLREIQQKGYQGGYTTLRYFLQPQRKEANTVAVRRFETPPGHQAQVDWGDLGDITQPEGDRHKLNAFVMTLGYSRALFCDIATDQKLPAFLRMHEAGFDYLGGVPQQVLYDNTKTVVLKTLTEGVDGRGEIKLNPAFADFARYWGFAPKLCRPYRPQTKGKVESGVGYLRKNFLCGREATDLDDLRQQIRLWTAEVANLRVHGTTYRVVREAWEEEKPTLQPLANRRGYPLVVECVRRVTRDAFVCWEGNRYSVPWQNAGRQVLVREVGAVVEILREQTQLAVHARCTGHHQTITQSAHHADIPTSGSTTKKARLSLTVTAPQVEVRSLDVYEALAGLEEVV